MNLLLYKIALLPLVQAWTFQYDNSANETTTIHGTKNLDCTDIDLPSGNTVSFDAEGTLPCNLLYLGANCPEDEHDDDPTTCDSWNFTSPANGNFRSVKVLVSGASTATASISTSTAIQTTASTATSISPSTSSESSSGSSGLTLSGGAIAGIVVGLVCAFFIVAAIFFFLGRRKRKAKVENQQSASQVPGEPIATTEDAKADVLTSAKDMPKKPSTDSHAAGFGPTPGSQLAELAASGGQIRPAELATNSVHELDTHK